MRGQDPITRWREGVVTCASCYSFSFDRLFSFTSLYEVIMIIHLLLLNNYQPIDDSESSLCLLRLQYEMCAKCTSVFPVLLLCRGFSTS